MPYSFQKLFDLISDYQQIKIVENRVDVLSQELRKAEAKRDSLKLKVEVEYANILSLEKYSIRQIFSKILKNDESQLDEERREYLLATLHYNESIKVIELLEFELRVLKAKKIEKNFLLLELENELDDIDSGRFETKSRNLIRLKEITVELHELVKLKVETHEALHITNELKDNYLAMIKLLNKAKDYVNWGNFYAEIQEGKALKNSYLDKAQAHYYVICKLMPLLRNEIQDVRKLEKYFKSSEGEVSGFNLSYYEYLISDWVNDKNLKETLTMTLTANSTIVKLIRGLEAVNTFANAEILTLHKIRDNTIIKVELGNQNDL